MGGKKKQKLFSIITTLFMMVTITFSGMTGIVKADVSNTITPTSWAYSVNSSTGDWTLNNGDTLDLKNLTPITDQTYKVIKVNGGAATIKGDLSKTFTNLAIEISGGANLTIENLNIYNRVWVSGAKSPVAVMDGNTGNTLTLNGTNEFYGAQNQAAVSVAGVNSLTIAGNEDGKVTATGGMYGAGIGGGDNILEIVNGGTISISGNSTVTATGGYDGAGIGGGNNGVVGTISISGNSTVTTTGGMSGAGIGGGYGKSGGTINITGGTVTATGGAYGAGIGGGDHGGAGGTISIVNSTVTATGGQYLTRIDDGSAGAGIGGGSAGAGGTISIAENSTVIATGGGTDGGSGIGGAGASGSGIGGIGGTISIAGNSIVTATGGNSGSGIGGAGIGGVGGALKIASAVSDIPIVKAYGISGNAIWCTLTTDTNTDFICCKASPSLFTNDTGMGINLTNINNPTDQVTLNLPSYCTSFATTVNANANYNIITTETPSRRSICKTIGDSNIFSSQHDDINFINSKIISNIPPTATDVNVTGTPKVGQTLTGHYTYNDANDTVGNSTYKWYRADNASGLNKIQIIGATSDTYVLTNADQGKYISFEVIPVATTGATTGIAVSSVAIRANTAPTAININITGILSIRQLLTGHYTYSDAENDIEGTSLFKWYRSDDGNGTNKTEIAGATNKTYTLTDEDKGKYISFTVTPVAQVGAITGTVVESAYKGTVVDATYRVTFNSQGGSNVTVADVVYNTNVTAPTAPTKASYTFGGWYKEAGCQNKWNFAVDKITADITLYAKWNKIPVTPSSPVVSYSVIYNGNGNTSGYVAVASVSYQQGTTVTVLENKGNLAKAGYTFAGWNTKSDGTGTNYAVGDKFVIGSSDVTLYANWIKKSIPENIKYVLIGDNAYNIKALFDASKKAEIMNAINSQNGNKIYYKINGKILSINGSLTNDDKAYLKGLKVKYEGDSDFSVPENDIQ